MTMRTFLSSLVVILFTKKSTILLCKEFPSDDLVAHFTEETFGMVGLLVHKDGSFFNRLVTSSAGIQRNCLMKGTVILICHDKELVSQSLMTVSTGETILVKGVTTCQDCTVCDGQVT